MCRITADSQVDGPSHRFEPEARPHRWRLATAALVVTAAVAVSAPPAEGKLAVFVDGRVLRVSDARLDVERERIVLSLPGGGRLAVPAARIDRVVSDEIDPSPEVRSPPSPACSHVFVDEPLPAELPFAHEILGAARVADIHPRLLAAVVAAESNFDPDAVSRAGAAGLTQLMPAAALDHGVRDVFDPVDNLRGGAAHLRRLVDRFDSLPLAIAAYNAGAATVDRYQGIPPYRETRRYVARVLGDFCGHADADRDPYSAVEPAAGG